MELYLDTADLKAIEKYAAMLPVRGVTTNPTIAAKGGIALPQLFKELEQIIPGGRFHAQVISTDTAGMVEEAKQLADLAEDMVVKIPVTNPGYAAMKQLTQDGLQITATAIYSAHQAFMAALCGAHYVAPYVNRIDTLSGNGTEAVWDLQQMLENNNLQERTKVLAASFKNAQQVLECYKAGIGSITLPLDVLAQTIDHPGSAVACDQFAADWQGAFGSKLSYQ